MTEIEEKERQLRSRLAFLTQRLDRIERDFENTPTADWSEHPTEAEIEEILQGLDRSGVPEMAAIHAALSRLADGNYATCNGCGTDIPMSRLNSVPHTTLCKTCEQQTDQDNRSKH